MIPRRAPFVSVVLFATVFLLCAYQYVFAQIDVEGGGPHPTCVAWDKKVTEAKQKRQAPPPPPECYLVVPVCGVAKGTCVVGSTLCKGTTACGKNDTLIKIPATGPLSTPQPTNPSNSVGSIALPQISLTPADTGVPDTKNSFNLLSGGNLLDEKGLIQGVPNASKEFFSQELFTKAFQLTPSLSSGEFGQTPPAESFTGGDTVSGSFAPLPSGSFQGVNDTKDSIPNDNSCGSVGAWVSCEIANIKKEAVAAWGVARDVASATGKFISDSIIPSSIAKPSEYPPEQSEDTQVPPQTGTPVEPDTSKDIATPDKTGEIATAAPCGANRVCFSDGREPVVGVKAVDVNKFLADDRNFSNPVRGVGSVYDDRVVSSGVLGGAKDNPNLFSTNWAPNGTMLEVCNAGTGQCTNGVNGDFGPHPRLSDNLSGERMSRIVDLPPGAAEAIGCKGLCEVSVRVTGVIGGDTMRNNVVAGLTVADRMDAGQSFPEALRSIQDSGSKLASIGPEISSAPVIATSPGGVNNPPVVTAPYTVPGALSSYSNGIVDSIKNTEAAVIRFFSRSQGIGSDYVAGGPSVEQPLPENDLPLPEMVTAYPAGQVVRGLELLPPHPVDNVVRSDLGPADYVHSIPGANPAEVDFSLSTSELRNPVGEVTRGPDLQHPDQIVESRMPPVVDAPPLDLTHSESIPAPEVPSPRDLTKDVQMAIESGVPVPEEFQQSGEEMTKQVQKAAEQEEAKLAESALNYPTYLQPQSWGEWTSAKWASVREWFNNQPVVTDVINQWTTDNKINLDYSSGSGAPTEEKAVVADTKPPVEISEPKPPEKVAGADVPSPRPVEGPSKPAEVPKTKEPVVQAPPTKAPVPPPPAPREVPPPSAPAPSTNNESFCVKNTSPLVVTSGGCSGLGSYNSPSIFSGLGMLLGRGLAGQPQAPAQTPAAPVPPPVATPTVPTAPLTPVVALIANPNTIQSGGKTKLAWASVSALQCTLMNATGTPLVTNGSPDGTYQTGALATTTIFSISCSTNNFNGNVYATTTVTVATSTSGN